MPAATGDSLSIAACICPADLLFALLTTPSHPLQPPLTSCKAKRRRAAAVSTSASDSVRKLLANYLAAKEQGGPDQAQVVLSEGLQDVVKELQQMTDAVQQMGQRHLLLKK